MGLLVGTAACDHFFRRPLQPLIWRAPAGVVFRIFTEHSTSTFFVLAKMKWAGNGLINAVNSKKDVFSVFFLLQPPDLGAPAGVFEMNHPIFGLFREKGRFLALFSFLLVYTDFFSVYTKGF